MLFTGADQQNITLQSLIYALLQSLRIIFTHFIFENWKIGMRGGTFIWHSRAAILHICSQMNFAQQ